MFKFYKIILLSIFFACYNCFFNCMVSIPFIALLKIIKPNLESNFINYKDFILEKNNNKIIDASNNSKEFFDDLSLIFKSDAAALYSKIDNNKTFKIINNFNDNVFNLGFFVGKRFNGVLNYSKINYNYPKKFDYFLYMTFGVHLFIDLFLQKTFYLKKNKKYSNFLNNFLISNILFDQNAMLKDFLNQLQYHLSRYIFESFKNTDLINFNLTEKDICFYYEYLYYKFNNKNIAIDVNEDYIFILNLQFQKLENQLEITDFQAIIDYYSKEFEARVNRFKVIEKKILEAKYKRVDICIKDLSHLYEF